MKTKDFAVGQTAYLLEGQLGRLEGTDRIRKVNVLKVGRFYVTIDSYGRRFALSGSRNPYLYEILPITPPASSPMTETAFWSNPAKLFLTYDDAVDEIKREALIKKIDNAPFKSIYDCTLAQLKQIDDILFSDKEGER